MTFRPGKALLVLATFVVIVTALVFLYPGAIAVAGVLAGVILSVAITEAILLRREISGVDVQRHVPVMVGRGREFGVTLTITSSAAKCRRAYWRDVVPPGAIPAFQDGWLDLCPGPNTQSYPLTIPDRGLHQFTEIVIRIIGPLGLFEVQKSWKNLSSVKVLPESQVPDEELVKDSLDQKQLLSQSRKTRHRGEGTEFESLSEYREGDDIRRINWRSSARMKHLIIQRYQMEQHRDVVILVDSGRLMGTAVGNGTKLDSAVDAALVIAKVALQGGDRCGVGVFDSKVRGFLSPVGGVAAHKTLLDRLYNVKPGWVETNFAPMFATLQSRQAKRSLIIILSDIMDMETTEKYRAALMSLKSRHVVLFSALRTPLLTDAANAPITNDTDAARKAFAFRLMRERERTLHSLHRNGVNVLDVEPKQLTLPLLNMYLTLKERTVA